MRNDEIRNDGTDRLVPLSNTKNFKVAKDNPDVRGWRVVGADGESLGVVKDLIVDTQELKVRYLSLAADKRFFSDNYEPFLLVPIGAAALDKKGNNVFVTNLDSTSITRYPTYQGGPITEDYEYSVREANLDPNDRNRRTTDTNISQPDYAQTEPQPVVTPRRISNDFYQDDNYNDARFYDSNRISDRNDTTQVSRHPDNDSFAQRSNANDYQTEGGTRNVEESISTIERLEQLRERGSITEEEFRTLKKRALDL